MHPGGVANPSYDPYQPPYMADTKPHFGSRNLHQPLANNINTINNNPAATFAASLLSSGVDEHVRGRGRLPPPPPPAFQGGSGRQAHGSLSERDLLGDFCSDFKKLSVTASPKGKIGDQAEGKIAHSTSSSSVPGT